MFHHTWIATVTSAWVSSCAYNDGTGSNYLYGQVTLRCDSCNNKTHLPSPAPTVPPTTAPSISPTYTPTNPTMIPTNVLSYVRFCAGHFHVLVSISLNPLRLMMNEICMVHGWSNVTWKKVVVELRSTWCCAL